jgi:isoamylase/glycogen operon protein
MEDQYPFKPGDPSLLGLKKKENAHYFCVTAKQSHKIFLQIFLESAPLRFAMYQDNNRFHIAIENLPPAFTYSYEIETNTPNAQPILAQDPYAKAVSAHFPFGNPNQEPIKFLSYYFEPLPFDWGQSSFKPVQENLIIYEMHIRGFTNHNSSNTSKNGTFLGAIEKIPYLKSIGINAIELLPIYEFNECEISFTNPKTNVPLYNFWGYSTLNFFSVMTRYGSTNDPKVVVNEFKQFVKACHDQNISVILDVVYNHTGELFKKTDYHSLAALSIEDYYILEDGLHTNFTGCGNTINSNNPICMRLILDSLRYFKDEFKIDGFRFDLASIFMRDPTGTPISNPPIIEAIQNDAMLKNCILISEPWDAAGLYHVGSFPKPFMEWNGWYRDIIRHFFNVGNIYIADLIDALKGSPKLYSRYKSPYDSINFITCHDGFTLLDLVSFKDKHNLENGEENRDGSTHNLSTNFGIEGLSEDPTLLFLRRKQILNFFTILFTSFGTPMIHMGDECGHTKQGNNNSWCQDNNLNYLNWGAQDEIILCGLKKLIQIRELLPFFKQKNYEYLPQILFMDAYGHPPDIHSYGNFIAMSFYDPIQKCHVYCAYNSSQNSFIIKLPKLKDRTKWQLQFNSYEFAAKKDPNPTYMEYEYPITGQTCIIAISTKTD